VAYDADLENGIRNLEEVLYRLEDRVKNAAWVKEHAPADAPSRIKEAITESFPQPKFVPPPAAPPVMAPPPAPVAPPAPAPVEIPVIAPVPAPKAAEPPPKAPVPVVKAPEPKPAPVLAPAPAAKPAKKPFVLNKTAVIIVCAGLAVAGIAYQLILNSPKSRYARAGQLVLKARNTEAISAYSRIIAQHPGSIEAAYSHYAIGDIKALQGNPLEAIEQYERYMVAAPDKDEKLASARFKVAELELKEDLLADAEYLFQNAAIQASDYATRAADRVAQIRAVKARVAEANKLMARSPAKAVEAYTAVLAEHPKYAAALAGLEKARKALAAANARPARRRAPAAKPRRR